MAKKRRRGERRRRKEQSRKQTNSILNRDQEDQLRVWMVAGCTNADLYLRCRLRGWPKPHAQFINNFRNKEQIDISALRTLELQDAMSKGLAIRRDRVAALKKQAERLLECVETNLVTTRERWAGPANNGRFIKDLVINNDLSREYRQTIRQLAEEMGDVTPDWLAHALLTNLPADIRNAVIQLSQESDDTGTTESVGEEPLHK